MDTKSIPLALEPVKTEGHMATKKQTQKLKGIFTSFSTFNLEAVSEHNTKDCFQNGERIKYWRKAHQGGAYIAESLTERADFREMAASVLGIDLEAEEVSNKVLQKHLITAGHCVEMKQIEREIERVEAGEKTSLAKDGNITFFFIENYDGSVSVVDVYWISGSSMWDVYWISFYSKWGAHVYRFDDDVRWGPGARVVSRNSSELSS
jgi:hypothetical protein